MTDRLPSSYRPCRWSVGDIVYCPGFWRGNVPVVGVKFLKAKWGFPAQWQVSVPGFGGNEWSYQAARADRPTIEFEQRNGAIIKV